MIVKDMAKLIEVHEKLEEYANYVLPDGDHSGTVLGLYADIADVIIDNCGDKYREELKVNDDCFDKVFDIMDNKNMSYTDRAKELLS